jgi:hypothetical protein
MFFQKGEPSVFPIAPGTGRDDRGTVGIEPVSRLFAASESPRLSGPEQAEGDRTMEGTATIIPPPAISSGEKGKARDIIAAIRTLQRIEREQRPATGEERQTLARFGGFGAVALSLFPDPVSGRYKARCIRPLPASACLPTPRCWSRAAAPAIS